MCSEVCVPEGCFLSSWLALFYSLFFVLTYTSGCLRTSAALKQDFYWAPIKTGRNINEQVLGVWPSPPLLYLFECLRGHMVSIQTHNFFLYQIKYVQFMFL